MSQCVLPVVPRDLLFLSHFSLRSDLLYCMHLYIVQVQSYILLNICQSFNQWPTIHWSRFYFIFNMLFQSYTFLKVVLTGNDELLFTLLPLKASVALFVKQYRVYKNSWSSSAIELTVTHWSVRVNGFRNLQAQDSSHFDKKTSARRVDWHHKRPSYNLAGQYL